MKPDWSVRHSPLRGPRRWYERAALLCAAVGVAVAIGACGAAGPATGSAHLADQHANRRSAIVAPQRRPPFGTFVSLVPACACGRHTELDLFSLSTGRMLRRLAVVSLGGYQQLATPAAASDGRLFLTYTSGARCALNGTFAECPGFAQNSCRNAVKILSYGQTRPQPLFAVSGSEAVTGEVVPDRDGRKVALTLTPCVGTRGTTGLYVRDLKSGAMHTIVSSSNRCDGYGPAAWSADGSQLVFPLDRAKGKPLPMAGGIACPEGRDSLALASTRTASHPGGLKLIRPDHGCIFRAAAFDRLGIVAAEGCDQGDPEHGHGDYLGRAYVLQYGLHGRLVRRLRLKLGLEEAIVATVSSTGNVLITQDEPGNGPYLERDWVWEFNGIRLRPIASYKANDAAQVLAVPW